MTNLLFTVQQLQVLARPERWRIVATGITGGAETVDDPSQAAWRAAHSSSHAHREALFVLSGEGTYGLAPSVYRCTPGTVFLFDAFEPHDDGYPPGCPDADHLWVYMFDSHCLARLLVLRDGVFRPGGEWCELLPGPVHTAHDGPLPHSAGIGGPLARLRAVAILSAIACAIVQRGYDTGSSRAEPSFQERVILSIQEHIERTAGREADLDTLSHISGYSRFHLLRMFKRHAGYTVHQYVDRCRLQRARELEARGLYHRQIAETLGFSSPSAFSRWYRRARDRSLTRERPYDILNTAFEPAAGNPGHS